MFPEHNHTLVSKPEQIVELLHACEKATFIGFDTETTGLRWWDKSNKVVGFGFGVYADKVITTWYLPCVGEYEQLVIGNLPILKNVLEMPITKVGANIKFDSHFMMQHGIRVQPLDDVQVLARLLRTTYKSVALDELMEKEFNAEHEEWHKLVAHCKELKLRVNQTYVEPGAYEKVDPKILGEYCGKDVYWTILLWLKYCFELKKQPKLEKLYYSIERPLINAVVDMEEVGVKIDRDYLTKIQVELTDKVAAAKTEVFNLAGKVFDIDSTKQLTEIFREKGIEPELRDRKKIVDGEQVRLQTPSYDKLCLEKYRDSNPFIGKLIEYREASKFLSTYVEGILDKAGVDDRIHTSLRQESARTGRFGCADPNLMNLPREDSGSELRQTNSIRKAFVPDGRTSLLVSIDYSQIEYRLMAHFCKDPVLTALFLSGNDFHASVASKLFNVPIDKVTREQRSIAKCFHPDTEVLTKAGWKKISLLSKGEEVIQALWGDGHDIRLEWAIPTEVFTEFHPDKKLCCFENENISLRVTPDHGVSIISRSGKYEKVRADNVPLNGYFVNAGALIIGDDVDIGLLRIAIAVQADGSFNGGMIRFGFTKERKIQRIRSLFSKAMIPYKEKISKQGATCFTISTEDAKPIRLLLEGKSFPWWWLSLSFSVREDILEEVAFWDGHTRDSWKMCRYFNKCKQSVDVIQAIAAVTNRKSSIRVAGNTGCFSVSIKRGSVTQIRGVKRRILEWDGRVACLTVPSSHVLIRDQGKVMVTSQTFNFAQLYGSGIDNLALKTHTTKERCKEIVETYNNTFKNVSVFKKSVERYCIQHGAVDNVFGRRRLIEPHLTYTGVNTLIQGTAADILKIAILRVHKFLKDKHTKLLFPVHDELVFNYNFMDGDIIPQIVSLMEKFERDGKPIFRIPIEVEISICQKNWADKQKFTNECRMDTFFFVETNEVNNRLDLISDIFGAKLYNYIEGLGIDSFTSAQLSTCYYELRELINRKATKKEFFYCVKKNLVAENVWIEEEDFGGVPDLPWEVASTSGGGMGTVQLPGEAESQGSSAESWT